MLEGRKLLLADDSLAIQRVIELTFVDEGMIVVSVGNGQLAVEKLEEVRPDIVLADVYMPELNGYQVCERIKRDERFQHVPVVLLVGSFEPFNEAEARRVGADDYLTKPFQSIRQLVSKVGSLLGGRKSTEESATQELPAPTREAETTGRARVDNLELTTADTSPLPPHMRHEAQAASAAPNQSFADLQLDDEMIEETPASKFGAGEQPLAGSRHRATEPFSAQDLSDMGVKTAAATTGQHLRASAAGVLADEASGTGSAPAPSSATAAPSPAHAASSATAGDDALLDLDDVEMPRAAAMAEADDFILDLQDGTESQSAAAPSAEVVSPSTAEDEAGIEAELAEEMTEAAPQAVEFSEAQVIGAEQREEFAPVEEAQLAPTGQLPEASPAHDESSGATQAAPTSGTPVSQPGQIELAQLSPEAIDAIARRVVEHLSTPVIEQIAWEVVPQLAELLIKRRLEEEGKK